MPVSARLPNHLRPRREKIFGRPQGVSLDRNAKTRIMVWVKAYNARAKKPGQHRGPITRAFFEVLEALLWGFHNSRSGDCYPSYERIAEKAGCCRDTVYEAIKVLEAAGILTWVNRLARVAETAGDLFGHSVTVWRVIRTSNAYLFRDPLPCADNGLASKAENPTGTQIQDLSTLNPPIPETKILVLNPQNSLDQRLISFGQSIGALQKTATA